MPTMGEKTERPKYGGKIIGDISRAACGLTKTHK
jgi:hypothetical protein